VSDIHGHVLSIPFVLLAIALCIELFGMYEHKKEGERYVSIVFYGLLVSVLLMTNALDGPIYFGLFVLLFGLVNVRKIFQWKKHWRDIVFPLAAMVSAAGLTSLPFLSHFRSFVSGIAVNCPLPLVANRTVGMVLFEGIEKCQHSPFWMLWMLWGFFWFCGLAFIWWRIRGNKGLHHLRVVWSTKFTQYERILVVLFFFSIGLIIFPEFFYFKDIYPAHFRSNTMFKLGYQAFIMFSLVSGYAIVQLIRSLKGLPRRVFLLLLLPQLFLVSIYPIFSVRSYFDSLRQYKGLHGLVWLLDRYPDDYAGIVWLGKQVEQSHATPVIVEADGDSYTDYERFSAFTGLPTVVGWPVHEWLWRGSYDVVAPRRDDVRVIYESDDVIETKRLLSKYGVSYIIVGTLEREKYPALLSWKFEELGNVVFEQGSLTIYKVE
jgi:YYY domain-containing protein